MKTFVLSFSLTLIYLASSTALARDSGQWSISDLCAGWKQSFEERRSFGQKRVERLNPFREKNQEILKALRQAYRQSGIDLSVGNRRSDDWQAKYRKVAELLEAKFQESHHASFTQGRFAFDWRYNREFESDHLGIIRRLGPGMRNYADIGTMREPGSGSTLLATHLRLYDLNNGTVEISVSTQYDSKSENRWDRGSHGIPRFGSASEPEPGFVVPDKPDEDRVTPNSIEASLDMKTGKISAGKNLEYWTDYKEFLEYFKGPVALCVPSTQSARSITTEAGGLTFGEAAL